MTTTSSRIVAIPFIVSLAWTWSCPSVHGGEASVPLLRVDDRFDVGRLACNDAQVARDGDSLVISTGRKATWPGVTIPAPDERWDLRGFGRAAVEVRNLGKQAVEVYLRVDNPGADGTHHCTTGHVTVAAGERETLIVPLQWAMPETIAPKLFGMRGYPNGWTDRGGIDPGNVVQLVLFVSKPAAEHRFAVSGFRAAGELPNRSPDTLDALFPMIDRYGQFIHKDWPGKIHDDADFARREEEESADLAAHPGLESWNQYGGWLAGPQLEATGFFRVAQHGGKWWLVDPEGRLFWSHGTTCVQSGGATTPITDREYVFAELPDQESPMAAFYGTGYWGVHGYYKDRVPYRTFNFAGANLLRKYGEDWAERFADLAHRRLRSWGMNTIANWSDRNIYLMRRTPYTATLGATGRVIEGSSGYWGKFPDPFDPSFRESLRKAMAAEHQRSAGDPWCIGYFVGNELSWGDELSLALGALASPPDQPAKQAVVAQLKQKYETITRLNEAWGSAYASWEAMVAATTPPDKEKARDDLADCYTTIANEFFRVCREEVKRGAPNQLYLGCRFAWANELAVRASAEYCDVISFNKYRRSIADTDLPEGIDLPIIIGEFHFGALDRGMLHTGLVPTASQQDRAAAYRAYVQSALDNRFIVGTHWFQFSDQATTGRGGDGENYQIGLIDACDTPYPETVQALRDVGAAMYRRRAEGP